MDPAGCSRLKGFPSSAALQQSCAAISAIFESQSSRDRWLPLILRTSSGIPKGYSPERTGFGALGAPAIGISLALLKVALSNKVHLSASAKTSSPLFPPTCGQGRRKAESLLSISGILALRFPALAAGFLRFSSSRFCLKPSGKGHKGVCRFWHTKHFFFFSSLGFSLSRGGELSFFSSP